MEIKDATGISAVFTVKLGKEPIFNITTDVSSENL